MKSIDIIHTLGVVLAKLDKFLNFYYTYAHKFVTLGF